MADDDTKAIANLLAERERLKKELKEKYPKVYKWFVDRGINLDELYKYSKKIAAAVALSNQIALNQPNLPPPTPVPEPTPPMTTEAPRAPPVETKEDPRDKLGKKAWDNYRPIIEKAAITYNVDPQLIFATIMTESHGNPYAYRFEPRINDASYGLGQILYGTARGLGYTGSPDGLYDPATNIDLIAKYHRRNIDRYKDLSAEQLTIAYNTGSPYKTARAGHLDRFNEWYGYSPS